MRFVFRLLATLPLPLLHVLGALAGWLVLDGRQEPERAAWALYAAGGCGADRGHGLFDFLTQVVVARSNKGSLKLVALFASQLFIAGDGREIGHDR